MVNFDSQLGVFKRNECAADFGGGVRRCGGLAALLDSVDVLSHGSARELLMRVPFVSDIVCIVTTDVDLDGLMLAKFGAAC